MLLQHKVAQAISPALFFLAVLNAQDAREIIRKSVELDQLNWLQMKHYTWTAFQTEKSLDSQGAVKSEKTEKWETVVLYGRPFRTTVSHFSVFSDFTAPWESRDFSVWKAVQV